MIKIHKHNSINPEHKPVLLSKIPSQIFQSNSSASTNCFGSMTLQINKNLSQLIRVKKNQCDKQRQILEWREKTEFPIVKVRSWKLISEKQIKQQFFLDFLVQLESDLKSLQDSNKIHFFQAIYVLKESLIGFQRLFHRFGNFNLTSEMIKFNKNNNCKVWVNQECFSNDYVAVQAKSQKSFIFQLCKIVWEKTIKSRNSTQFFQKIQNCKYFFEAIGVIDTFTKANKIKIPNSLQNLDQSRSPLLKTSLNMDMLLRQKKSKNLVSSIKIPAFIRQNEVKKKNSTQTYTPMPRKISSITKACIFQRSLTNISRNLSSNSRIKKENTQKKAFQDENQIVQEDDFLKNLNIRLIEPSPQKKKIKFTSFVQNHSGWGSNFQNLPETPITPYGRVSQFGSDENDNSILSFNKCKSKQYFSPFESAQKIFLTVVKPQKATGAYSSISHNNHAAGKKIKQLKGIDVDQQSLDDFKNNQIEPISQSIWSGSQNKQKRKLSGDFGNSSGRNFAETSFREQIKLQNSQLQFNTENTLRIPTSRRNNEYLIKSTSQQAIKRHRKTSDCSDAKQQSERQLLRETIMGKNGWKEPNLLSEPNDIKQSFVDGKQIPQMYQSKTNELAKLGIMGRDVKSSMISGCQFQIEFSDKLQKQKQIRNQIMDLLN